MALVLADRQCASGCDETRGRVMWGKQQVTTTVSLFQQSEPREQEKLGHSGLLGILFKSCSSDATRSCHETTAGCQEACVMVNSKLGADPYHEHKARQRKEKRDIGVCGISRLLVKKTLTHSSTCSILVSMRGGDRTTEDGPSTTITASGTGSILSTVPVAIRLQKTQIE
jgi:hypothetical protein